MCDSNLQEKFAKESIQCKPNAASCQGSMVTKGIKFAITKGHELYHCKRSFTVLDAMVRSYVSIVIGTSTEKDLRGPCDKIENPEQYKRGKSKGKFKGKERMLK